VTTNHSPPVSPGAPPSDAALIGRSVDDPATFAMLFERHYDVVHRYIARRLGGGLADELASETFTRAFDHRRAFDRTNTDARPWLLGIATNLMRRHWRTERRRLAALQRLAGDRQLFAAGAEAPQAEVLEALRSLPRDEREALLLLAWADLSYEQIAVALAVPIGTVRSRLSRARSRMRTRLGVPADVPVLATPSRGSSHA
jgi:RNA polymerase sigma-70 factor (ECF subfamily)